ncbi:rod shape-determining protein MreD [Conexibacter sp. SYSU D00693]|uniref:rod shape-determining protein MreD n=1 Tax=Conexibacter sp. SYSU D00693 TaxID=2812560 RepID=UPI00196B7CC6|nr:rod shape-determining protein MreD [Conexibacter sp. SYSU D00693]
MAARLAVLGFALSILQVAFVSQLPIAGSSADLLPLTVASVGLLCGSVPGAVFGFAVGLFADIAYAQTMGLSSLVFTVAGYAAGRFLELRDPQNPIMPMAVGAAITLLTAVGFGLMNFLLGIDAPVSLLLLRLILVTVVLNALLALPLHALVRRALGSDLPGDGRRRRRRAYTTGGLSPLSQARG